MPTFTHPFRTPKTLRAFTRSSKGGRVSFISLPCSFAIGLGLTEALHVGPYQRDLELSHAGFRVGVSSAALRVFLILAQ